jgi:polar amino acid transport system permease protein
VAFDLIPDLLPGVRVTVEVTVVATALAIACAFAAGCLRLVPWLPVRFAARAYVELFRGSSAFVQLYVFFYVLPIVGLSLTPFTAGVCALGLNFGAYGSEIVRAGIRNVPAGQREAAETLGLKPHQAMLRIIIPQAIPRMLPGFGNLAIELLKATSLVSFVTIADLTFQGKLAVDSGADPAETFVTLLFIYLALALPLLVLTRWLERRTHTGPRGGPVT